MVTSSWYQPWTFGEVGRWGDRRVDAVDLGRSPDRRPCWRRCRRPRPSTSWSAPSREMDLIRAAARDARGRVLAGEATPARVVPGVRWGAARSRGGWSGRAVDPDVNVLMGLDVAGEVDAPVSKIWSPSSLTGMVCRLPSRGRRGSTSQRGRTGRHWVEGDRHVRGVPGVRRPGVCVRCGPVDLDRRFFGAGRVTGVVADGAWRTGRRPRRRSCVGGGRGDAGGEFALQAMPTPLGYQPLSPSVAARRRAAEARRASCRC